MSVTTNLPYLPPFGLQTVPVSVVGNCVQGYMIKRTILKIWTMIRSCKNLTLRYTKMRNGSLLIRQNINFLTIKANKGTLCFGILFPEYFMLLFSFSFHYSVNSYPVFKQFPPLISNIPKLSYDTLNVMIGLLIIISIE